MCYDDGYGSSGDFVNYKWPKARKEYSCCACNEKILIGELYHKSAGLFDGDFQEIKHCARCWRMIELLWKEIDWVEFELNCGEIYEGNNTEMFELAFWNRDDKQEFAIISKIANHN